MGNSHYINRNTHLGCFGAPGEAGGCGRTCGNVFQKSGFQIRQGVPVGLLGLRIAAGLVGLDSLCTKIYV